MDVTADGEEALAKAGAIEYEAQGRAHRHIAGGTGAVDDDGPDRAITGSALDGASEAALREAGGGRVTETEAGDDESYYEVEVTKADGSEVDVQLDRRFAVVSSETDREDRD